ncbi:3-hydroxyacyl-CoA dehydrogenase, partial [Delphinella strobiligena]
ITIIGAGTIGLSFAALHLNLNPKAYLTIYDTRPDLETYITSNLPKYLDSPSTQPQNQPHPHLTRVKLALTLQTAVRNAHIIQEQGPENATWKRSTWAAIEPHAPRTTLFWSSTSGIPASIQNAEMRDKTRLLIVHPYNPPHIMPLLEIVPTPHTSPSVLDATITYWRNLGREPVVLKKECTGFVANRLAFALFREAIGLVNEGVIGVKELDDLVTASMGPRWAVQGPFKSYHAGGGEGGLREFMDKIGGTVRECWGAGEEIKVGVGGVEGWEEGICGEVERVYGRVDTGVTGRLTRGVLEVTR